MSAKALCIISKPSVKSVWNYAPETLKSVPNWILFGPCDLEIWWMTLKEKNKQYGTSSMLLKTSCVISKPSVNSIWSHGPETFKSVLNWRIFGPCDLENWLLTLKNNRAPLLCHPKLYAQFRSHMWLETGVRLRKYPDGKFVLTSVTVDLWPWPLAGTSFCQW